LTLFYKLFNILPGVARRYAVSQDPLKGGEAMSGYELTIIVFGAVTIVITLIKLMIYIADKFSKKK
jgi:hypothetical protein